VGASMPEPAATVVLLSGTSVPRVHLLQRAARSAFMPSAWVFPGGRLDILDRAPRALERVDGLDGESLAARMHGVDTAELALALAICAAREAFEESGVLLATPASLARVPQPELQRARARLCAGDLSFPKLLVEYDLRIDGGALTYFDHWITPPLEARRFDTRFFVARVDGGQNVVPDMAEVHAAEHLSPVEALERHAAGALALAPPTFWILGELAALGTAEAVLAWAAAREVPPVRPSMVQVDGVMAVVLPGDPLHPGPTTADAGTRRVVWRGDAWKRE